MIMSSTRYAASYNPSRISQEGYRSHYGRSQTVTEGKESVNEAQADKLCHSEAEKNVLTSKRAETSTRSLRGNFKIQPEGLQQCISAQRVSNPCRSVGKLHELLPDCEKASGPSQHLQFTHWMSSIDGKEKYDSFTSRMEEKQPSTT
ncbi:hypothetical protein O181_050658 [Austropuccinia psidii MF-1]|uniref:Uncharacterized protein n=1 Tax=Austropuccinia psidii MF-1 TaxID=1389203 RepID=A0A9Q3E260_9BASI|nr:hypothetical protein [Austropuccinia psidii MF-1]